MRVAALVVLVLPALLLAGCGSPAPAKPAEVAPGEVLVEGVVVDAALRPIAAAHVVALATAKDATTDDEGKFALALEPGAVVLEATHRAFAPARLEVQVAEGMAGIVLAMPFLVSEAPYSTVLQYNGFIVCSLGVSVVFSEECGEGVGTPVGRFGKQAGNAIRNDFQAESPALKTAVIEMVWTPTSEAGKELLVLFATGWACEPACDGNRLGNTQGPSPLLLRTDEDVLADALADPATVFTTYTLARNDVFQVNVVLNQAFQLFVSLFYREPAPAGHSFVALHGGA